jgi:hypothetical protein
MNSILLDTHIFIWLAENDANLPISIRDLAVSELIFGMIIAPLTPQLWGEQDTQGSKSPSIGGFRGRVIA